MNNLKHQRICVVCGKQFWSRLSNGKFCKRTCQNYLYNHEKSKRLSNKLTKEQRDIILALQDYFIRNWNTGEVRAK